MWEVAKNVGLMRFNFLGYFGNKTYDNEVCSKQMA